MNFKYIENKPIFKIGTFPAENFHNFFLMKLKSLLEIIEIFSTVGSVIFLILIELGPTFFFSNGAR